MERCFTQADLNKARMRREFWWGERCGREKPRLAAATSDAASDRHRQGQCLRVLQRRALPFVSQRKTRSLWLPARVVAVPAVSRCRAQMRCGDRNGQVLASDVAARDVQAATSPASWIAKARRKSWRFAGGGSGQKGKAVAAKANSLTGLRMGNQSRRRGLQWRVIGIYQSVWVAC